MIEIDLLTKLLQSVVTIRVVTDDHALVEQEPQESVGIAVGVHGRALAGYVIAGVVLWERSVATSIPDAAYRFCRDEPGTHVILSGTGNPAHLRANLASFERPPLPEADRRRLEQIFRRVDSVAGN